MQTPKPQWFHEESYLELPKKERTWCKIDDKGTLEYVDWDIVEDLASQFDKVAPNLRSEQMLIGKLMVLVREQTRQEMSHDSGQRK
jgi:hypothetical protein